MRQTEKLMVGMGVIGVVLAICYVIFLVGYAFVKDPVFGWQLTAGLLAWPVLGFIVGQVIAKVDAKP